MPNILLILSSQRGEASLSTRFATELVEGLKSRVAGSLLSVRDLARSPIPHIDTAYIDGRTKEPAARSPSEAKAVARTEELIAELSAADIVVIGSGMINFGVSSLFKAYIDHVIWPGVTVKYADKGAEGLIKGKKVYVVTASGGAHSDGLMKTCDYQTAYLKHLLNFIGLTGIEEIRIEGTAFGPDAAQAVIDQTSLTVRELVGKAA